WAVVQKNSHDLVVSTYGRGLYILDDISFYEELAKKHSDAAVQLVVPRSAYRFSRGGEALIDFTLKPQPKDPLDIEILYSNQQVMRGLKVMKAHAGLNRAKWDLHHEPPRVVALRTNAPENPHIWLEPRFRDIDSRPVTHWGIKPAEVGPMVAPGDYTIRLKVEGQSYTQPIHVLRDPRTPAFEADLDLSVKTQLRVRDDINRVSDAVNQIEWM